MEGKSSSSSRRELKASSVRPPLGRGLPRDAMSASPLASCAVTGTLINLLLKYLTARGMLNDVALADLPKGRAPYTVKDFFWAPRRLRR